MARGKLQFLLTAFILLAGGIVSPAQILPEKSPQAPPKTRRKPPPRVAVQEPELAEIPAGDFRMGSENGGSDEKPVHRVFVSKFYMAKYLVTNADYKLFVDATGRRAPASPEKGRTLWSGRTFPPEIARQPVVKVSWDDATAYGAWLSEVTGKPFGLPTEAEWEKAARGGLEQKKYPWGDQEPDDTQAWFGKPWSGLLTLRDVDFGPPTGFGLYSIVGNVWEWVSDIYNGHYYEHPMPRDPQGSFGGLDHVLRGGSAFGSADHLRCAARGYRLPTERWSDTGFRVARR